MTTLSSNSACVKRKEMGEEPMPAVLAHAQGKGAAVVSIL